MLTYLSRFYNIHCQYSVWKIMNIEYLKEHPPPTKKQKTKNKNIYKVGPSVNTI